MKLHKLNYKILRKISHKLTNDDLRCDNCGYIASKVDNVYLDFKNNKGYCEKCKEIVKNE